MKQALHRIALMILTSWFGLCAHSPLAAEELSNGNILPDPGFEMLPEAISSPSAPFGGWKTTAQSKFAILRRSDEDKRGGKFSLHLKDDHMGKTNEGLYLALDRKDIENYRGKTLRASAWIRQVGASKANSVSVGLRIEYENEDGSGKKVLSAAEGPDTEKTTNWNQYAVTLTVPENATLIWLQLNCGAGWGTTAEAFFDDIALECVPADMATQEERISGLPGCFTIDENGASHLYFFQDDLLPGWQRTAWGGGQCEMSEISAKSGRKGLRLKSDSENGAKEYAGLRLFTESYNRRVDASSFPLASSYLDFWMAGDTPVQIGLINSGGQTNNIHIQEESPFELEREGNWRHLRIPLLKLLNGAAPDALEALSLQIVKPMTSDKQILLDEIRLSSLSRVNAPVYCQVPDDVMDKALALCGGSEIFEDDTFDRPIIQNGTFYQNGKPVFYLGPWTSTGSLATDWGKGSERDWLKDPVYTNLYGKAIADRLGMNSAQHSCANLLAATILTEGAVGSKSIESSEKFVEFLRGLGGMPIVMDFAFLSGLAHSLVNDGIIPPESLQNNSDWHEFIPLCPEHPDGWNVNATYFKTGAQFTLRHGGNPFVYELFNESSYNCRCRINRDLFRDRMTQKYGDIDRANMIWGTSFHSFQEASDVVRQEVHPGLWVDWCKFMGDRYAEVLTEGKLAIREVDKRENVYFAEQIALSNIWNYRGAGMDYRKIAEATDMLGIESGWEFGRKLNVGKDKGNAMEEAMASSGTHYSLALDIFRSIAKNKTPILNLEHYCKRMMFGKRVPSRAEDITTAMWAEVFHGASGSYMYAWNKRIWEWRTMEEAQEMVERGDYRSHHLLVPAAYPRESLDGFRRFANELDGIRELALPTPRLKTGTIALLHSYPTVRMSGIARIDVGQRLGLMYEALLFRQYPVDVIMEEDLSQQTLSAYQALIVPAAEYTYPETLKTIEGYVRSGGLLFCQAGAFGHTEYGEQQDASELLGLAREPNEPNTVMVDFADSQDQVFCRKSVNVVPAGAQRLDAAGVLFEHVYGNGCVYYAAGETDVRGIQRMLNATLGKNPLRRYGHLSAEDGLTLAAAEFQVIDRGDEKLMLLVNWEDRGTRLVRLHLENLGGGELSIYPDGACLASRGGARLWSAPELAEGVLIALPPQTRFLLRLRTQTAESNPTLLTQQRIKEDFVEIRAQEKDELEKLDRREQELIDGRTAQRTFSDVREQACFPIELKLVANMGFEDKVDGDQKGGWFDQGPNDFRNMPLGRNTLANVPFWIQNPAENNGKSVVVLRGTARKYFPPKAEGIPVGRAAKRLYILHTAGWGIGDGDTCYTVYVNYDDGTATELPIVYKQHLSGWWKPSPVEGAKIALESSNMMCGHIGLYAMRWENPHPQKVIASLDLISVDKNIVPAIVAITGESP